jgi:hypothetical protein
MAVRGATQQQQQRVSAETLASISTPDRVDSRLGRLEFTDGAPSEATAQLLYDHLDFVHGVEAFINGPRPRSTNPDGSTDIYMAPTPREGKTNNWLRTVAGKGFGKSWRPSEIEPI